MNSFKEISFWTIFEIHKNFSLSLKLSFLNFYLLPSLAKQGKL